VTQAEETLQQLLARLQRELLEADARYNAALTELDRSIRPQPELPHPPPAYDTTGLDRLSQTWDLLPAGPPAIDRSLKGRLRAFIWRLVGPSFETQRQFNAALVEHLHRNLAVHEERQKAAASTIALCADQALALAHFQTHLIQYLQTITLYIDSRDRSAQAGVHVLNAGFHAATDEFLKRWESLSTREARINSRVDAVAAEVNDLRATAAVAQQSALSLKREVERLLERPPSGTAPAGAGPAVDLDSFKYLGFENEFRGSTAEIRRRLEAYVPMFEGRTDVLDVGCGRGEFLDLLRAKGVAARGIDINDAMVEEARARGLSAEKADALTYLNALPDDSLGGLFAAQVVEHLSPEYLAAFLETAGRKVRHGGVIVLETINPTSWVAFFESYIRDLTHVRPLHPETMQYMLRVSGFAQVRVLYSSPIAPEGQLMRLPELPPGAPVELVVFADTFNRNVDLLNSRTFGPQDYAVIGIRE
jgi:SAM-dependent methyltransferase